MIKLRVLKEGLNDKWRDSFAELVMIEVVAGMIRKQSQCPSQLIKSPGSSRVTGIPRNH